MSNITMTNKDGGLENDMASLDVNDPSYDGRRLALDMQAKCRLLLEELEQFQTYLKEQKRERNVEIRTFKGGLQAEMKLIDKVCTFIPVVNEFI